MLLPATSGILHPRRKHRRAHAYENSRKRSVRLSPAVHNHASVPKSIPVCGFIYDVKSGKLQEVAGAKTAAAG